MEHVSLEDVSVPEWALDIDKRPIGEALGTTDVSVNRYELAPQERLSGLHAHGNQEEVFVVLEGAVAFETLDGVVTTEAGEVVRFAPGEHKSPTNDSDSVAVVLALGAPADGGDLLIPLACPGCGHGERLATVDDEGDEVLACDACGHEAAARCPSCGGSAMRAVLQESGDDPIGRCMECGAVAEQ